MERRPWVIVFISAIYFIAPFVKLLFSMVVNDVDLKATIMTHYDMGYFYLFQFYLLLPIAGVSIFLVKKWSLPLFLLLELWILIFNFPAFKSMYVGGEYFLLAFITIVIALHILIIVYLLFSSIKLLYLDPRLRWWECVPRYKTTIPCNIEGKEDSEILNISVAGAFVVYSKNFQLGEILRLTFAPLTNQISISAKIIHSFTVDENKGYGIKFIDLSIDDKNELKKMVHMFEIRGIERRPPKFHFALDLLNRSMCSDCCDKTANDKQ